MELLGDNMTKSSQLALVNGDALTEQDVLSAVDMVIQDLNETGNINKATDVLNTLDKIENTSGRAKAKLLYGMYKWWLENNDKKSFNDFIESRTSLKPVTVDRYITVEDCIETGEIPEDVAVRPMRELVPIAKTLSHGHSIDKKQWERIIKATGPSEIRDILRNIKNKPPRKSSLQIYMDRDGSLYAWKDNKKVFIGWLDMEAYASNENAHKAIDRIVDNSGVVKK